MTRLPLALGVLLLAGPPLFAIEPPAVRVVPSRLVPKGAAVVVVRAGAPGPGADGHNPVARVGEFGKEVRLPDAGPFDVYLVPEGGRAVRVAEKWKAEGGPNEFKLADRVGAVAVRGDLPRAAKVVLTTPDDPGLGAKGHKPVQEVTDYKDELLAPPGFYAVWVRPANGARPRKVADKVRVHAGKTARVPEE